MNKKFLTLVFALLLSSCHFYVNSSSKSSHNSTNSLTDSNNSISSSSTYSSGSSNGSSSSNNSSSSSSSSSGSSSSQFIDDKLWDTTQNNLRDGKRTFEFYNFNDFHGSVASNDKEPGIIKLSNYIKTQRQSAQENNKSFILTSTGDMWQGSADSNITRGRLVTDWMNLLDFKAMALGNHEFDWTIDTIKENQVKANFPFLACNIIYTETRENVDWVQPYTTLTVDGLRIGIIGAIGEGITSSILASNVKGLTFADPISYVIKHSNYLRENGADIIVYLYHYSSSGVSSELKNYVDFAFLGHTHKYESVTSPFVMIQGWCNGKAVSHVSLDFDFTTSSVKKVSGKYDYLTSIEGDDEETRALYDKYLKEEINAVKNEVVGYTNTEIGYNDVITNLLKYMADYYNDYLKEDYKTYSLYCTQHNNARSSIPSGDITYGNIYKALPFDNELCLVEVDVSNLDSYLSYGKYNELINRPTSGKVYVLTIDYIATTDYRTGLGTIIARDSTRYPRDIFKMYCAKDFPLNS